MDESPLRASGYRWFPDGTLRRVAAYLVPNDPASFKKWSVEHLCGHSPLDQGAGLWSFNVDDPAVIIPDTGADKPSWMR